MYKKIIGTVILLTMILTITSCSSSETTQRYAWPLGTASSEDTVTHIFAQKFADEVFRLSEGEMKIQVYSNGTLGGDRELLESCKAGDIPFVVQNTAPQVSFMPKLSIFDMPVVYTDIDDVRKAVDNEKFYGMIENIYKEAGYKILGFADQSFRVMSSNVKIENIDDFKGIKIRTMENANHIAFWKALGTNPTPMSFSEVYIGLQQGTIVAQENPYEVIKANKLYEQQDYIINTNHLPHLISLTVSDDFFEGLSVEEQDIIIEASEIAREYARNIADERTEDVINDLLETGTQLVELSEELNEEIKSRSEVVYKSIAEQTDAELVDTYLNLQK